MPGVEILALGGEVLSRGDNAMKSLVKLNNCKFRFRWVSLLTASVVLVGLLIARKTFDVPKPLIITLGLSFAACLCVGNFIAANRPTSILQGVIRLLIPWSLISLTLLFGIHSIDRGGWIWYQVSGYNGSVAVDLLADVELSPTEFVKANSFFVLHPNSNSTVVLPAGEYAITRTIVFPRRSLLVIEPGAIVKLGAGCSLISYSPVQACGTAREPIVFTAKNRWFKWGVIGVVSTEKSVFENVRLEHARQAFVNGIDFPGGLSVIETDAEIRNCQFIEMFGKDAIYSRQGHVLIRDNRVEVAFKDGIDLDDSSGEIRGNLLIDCDDEGIDLSDNLTVTVQQNTIRDRHGGRIAANRELNRIRLANTLEFSKRD